MRWSIGLRKRLNHPLRCSMKASIGLSHSKMLWRSFAYWKACAQSCLFGFQMMKQDSQLKFHIKSQTTLPWFLTSVKTQWVPMMWTKRSSFERLRKIILRAWWLSWIPSSFQRSWTKDHGQIMWKRNSLHNFTSSWPRSPKLASRLKAILSFTFQRRICLIVMGKIKIWFKDWRQPLFNGTGKSRKSSAIQTPINRIKTLDLWTKSNIGGTEDRTWSTSMSS